MSQHAQSVHLLLLLLNQCLQSPGQIKLFMFIPSRGLFKEIRHLNV